MAAATDRLRERSQSLTPFTGDSRSGSQTSERTLVNMSETELEERSKAKDLEKGPLDASPRQPPGIITKDHVAPDPYARAKLLMWMAINTLATVFIVFCNKAIFSDPSFGQCQAAFAAFHFFVTFATLLAVSRPRFQMFSPKWGGVSTMMPLAIAMAGNVVGMNLSLQISTVTFYQITRVLLTPTTAVLNFFFYAKSMPRMAVYALIPMCLGVALISYYDVKPPPPPGAPIKDNGVLGTVVALGSVFISGIYTVWVGTYQRKYEMNGFQLLYNQAPIGGVVLMYVLPWTDKFPSLDKAPASTWHLILFSGVMASLINISQFYIIGNAGPVESTVVGHLKTCLIVLIGAFTGGRVITDKAALGIMLALLSIFTYSAIMMRQPK